MEFSTPFSGSTEGLNQLSPLMSHVISSCCSSWSRSCLRCYTCFLTKNLLCMHEFCKFFYSEVLCMQDFFGLFSMHEFFKFSYSIMNTSELFKQN